MSVWLDIKQDICRSLAHSLGYRILDRPFGSLTQEQEDFRFRNTGGRIHRYLGNAMLGITSAVTTGEATSPLAGYISAAAIALGAVSMYASRKKASDAFDEHNSPIARAVRTMERNASTEWLLVKPKDYPC